MKRYKLFGTGIACLLYLATAQAQDSTRPSKWNWLIEPYLMFPNMTGQVGVDSLPDVAVDQDPTDIFSKLQIGVMLYLEMSNEKWAFSSDLIYMKLGSPADIKNGVITGDVTLKQLAWELAALKRVNTWLEAGLAVQLNSIQSDIDIVVNRPGGPVPRKSEVKETWVDPSLTARVQFPIGQNFFYVLRGNIGGFGIGSDFYWQAHTYVGYRFIHWFQVSLGYRVIDINYDKASGGGRFLYDMTTFGPELRFGFHLN